MSVIQLLAVACAELAGGPGSRGDVPALEISDEGVDRVEEPAIDLHPSVDPLMVR